MVTRALLESEVKYRTLVENSLAGVYIYQDNLFRFVNKRFCEIYGYTCEEIVDKLAPMDMTHPEDRNIIGELERKCLAGESEDLRSTHRAIRKDGATITVNVLGSPMTYRGRPAISGTVYDITEQKRVEEQLRQKTALLEAQVNASLDGIIVADKGKKIIQNQQVNHLFKIPRHIAESDDEEAQIEWVRGLAKDPEQFYKNVTYGIAHPGETTRDEFELKDGTVLDTYFSPVIDKNGRHCGKIVTFRDITERKRSEEALRASQLHLSEAMDLAHIVYWEFDPVAQTYVFNDPFYTFYGTTAEQEGGYRMTREDYAQRFIHPDDLPSYYRFIEENALRQDPELLANVEHRIIRRDGDVRHILARTRTIKDESGRVVKRYGANQDITDRRKMEDALRESETKLRAILDGSRDAIGVSKDGIRTFANPAYVSLFGYESADELIGAPTIDLIAPESRGLVTEMMKKRAAGEPAPSFYEVTALRKDGTTFLAEASASTYVLKGEQFTLVILRDITDRKQAEEQLLHNAFYDGLTDLPNRALFTDRLGHALRRANRTEDHSCAVIFLDLDRFKVINDSLGHMVGDKLLKETARRLEKCIRQGDTVARLGGDEFVMLCERTHDVATAKAIADRIQDALSAPFVIEGSEIRCSASMGIALTCPDYKRPEEVLRDADITMYRAKALGRARCEVFDPSMRLEAAALLQLENDLRRALDLDEFRIHYQPIVALGNGETTGLEALIRWQHPHRGLVPPSDFIPLAEETGLIVPIGEWVLRTACSQMKTWQEEGLAPLRISVNVSTVQLRQADFVDMVMGVLAETGIEPGLLDLEVTESVLVDRNESIIGMFHRLKALGIRICLDDFGTGYSSLSYLQGLPIDVLKIDASFTKNLTSDKERGKIVETILMLGKSLGTEVIAEGIETDEQLKYLKAIECGTGQGFFFSKAVDEKAIKAMFLPGSRKSSQPLGR
jgi:diguanylate cyclase (GGDEF)-like protein/PAS domain S-box-containing protein